MYLNALHNPFVYDDYHTVVANTSIQSVANLRAMVLHDVKRPIVNVSYAIDRALWGPAPLGFHVTNVLLHMLNVVLLFHLALRGWRATGSAAFAAAALFAVHPMMTEAVGYISGRSELLCATFFLPAVMCGRRWLRGDGVAVGGVDRSPSGWRRSRPRKPRRCSPSSSLPSTGSPAEGTPEDETPPADDRARAAHRRRRSSRASPAWRSSRSWSTPARSAVHWRYCFSNWTSSGVTSG